MCSQVIQVIVFFLKLQSEEEKLAMERKVQLAEQAATIMHSSLHHDYEREEFGRRSLGEGGEGDGGLSPPTLGSIDSTTNAATATVVSIGIHVYIYVRKPQSAVL